MSHLSPLRARRSRDLVRAGAVVSATMLVVLLGVTIWIGSLAGNGVDRVVEGALDSAADTAMGRVEEYLGSAEDTTAGLAGWVAQNDPSPAQVADRLLVAEAVDSTLRTVAVAYPDGSWVAVTRGIFPSEEAFTVVTSSGLGGAESTTEYSSGLVRVSASEQEGELDAEELGFWSTAASADALVWTDPARKALNGDIGSWAAQAVRDDAGNVVAVVASDFTLDSLAEAVNAVSLGDSAGVYVLDSQRRVLVAPEMLRADLEDAFETGGLVDDKALSLTTSAVATPEDATIQLGFDGDVRTAEVGLESLGVGWILHVRAIDDEISPEVITLQGALAWAAAILFGMVIGASALFFVLWRPFSEMRSAAYTDSLTGLLRRGRFIELASATILEANRAGGIAYVVVLDLDNFKELNDAQGHDAGDAALTEVGRAMEAEVRRKDLVSRWGGDEFVALLMVPDAATGEAAMERLRAGVADALDTAFPKQHGLGVTAGGAPAAGAWDDVEELITLADEALVEGKQHAKSRSYAAHP
ncbi:diguanylate cyclase [Demequina sp. NBRC 110054]|uniref:GGDEF domain-containing protein n=1 Tax=Demequina sp. NBRC 110054 TaxID=1570343 RepID=UPI0009FEEFD0|nr:sensor domain-containing diguanylate cyclase [Demequina sp. NBRC 110054]